MAKIERVIAREILDSRGQPTVEVDIYCDQGMWARAAVPSGASTGAHEALELRDGDARRYFGKGVLKAVSHINEIIGPKVRGMSLGDQKKFDEILLELDGTENKSRLGANSILGVSLAHAKASSQAEQLELYQWLGGPNAVQLPVPLMNVINGGAHADNGLDVQEFMIVPTVGGSFREALRAGAEVFQSLKKELGKRGLATSVGDEGGFAPKLRSNREALEILMLAIESAGYRPGQDIHLALDVAATELFKNGKYEWEGQLVDRGEVISLYALWSKEFPLVSIEDGLSEDDWQGWAELTTELGSRLQLVGDDLFVTNPKRLERGIVEKSANAILVKVNQIGSLTETIAAIDLAHTNGMRSIMSHRSGETEDTTIADLCVALGSSQIKTGSLCRSERTAKYNRLLRIEEQLGNRAQFKGNASFLDAKT